ncbi:hypothetical protein BDY21DRAFT_128460 [Lineolata rhizophorae]|uniref:Sialidase n=1 Tax=Lineolata rhizophorae TaxID=578093 RepID=A0A6A6NNN0_9PEZI|nr:hypothetical protein BDY21DRAFT_128460 [Lineolata rhizophorae]
MYHRQLTPPSATEAYLSDGSVARNVSDLFYDSLNSSPDSILTNITPPPRSPPIRHNGPMLLPKVRTQDQVMEPVAQPIRHRRTTSTASAGYTGGYQPYPQHRPPYSRRSTSPPKTNDLISPVSTSSFDNTFSTLNSPINFASSNQSRRPSLAHARSHSSSATVRGHSRSGSASSVDESVLGRYGYPTYRKMPSYVTASAANSTHSSLGNAVAMPVAFEQPQYNTHYKQSMDTAQMSFGPVDYQFTAPVETQFDTFADSVPTSTILEYLTEQNCSPSLCRRVGGSSRSPQLHYWWDVRNLRSWTDFNVDTISAIDGLLPLLQVPVPATSLPTPPRPNLQPDSEVNLLDIWHGTLAQKVNAALKLSQGSSHMSMRVCSQPEQQQAGGSSQREQPDLASNYASDAERTFHGDRRARLVGVVKSYHEWNSGMRSEPPHQQVKFLRALAKLHHLMREHGCRYGFILTEIELLCVRAGGPNYAGAADPNAAAAAGGAPTGQDPVFGYLELATPISMATFNQPGDAQAQSQSQQPLQMTAALALWYLHMLAKESPLPGMGSWRMDCGGPVLLTRQNCLERDAWIPKVSQQEMRPAKRVRGWVWPSDPLDRKRECGKARRGSSAVGA